MSRCGYGFLFLLLALAQACIAQAKENWSPVARFIIAGYDVRYRLGVEKSEDKPITWRLEIVCEQGCKRANTYSAFPDSAGFDGVFYTGDDLVTVWEEGDGMSVRVYRLTKTSITEVLEAPTHETWPIMTEAHGESAIILGDKTIGQIMRGDRDPVHRVAGKVYVGDGKAYKPQPP